MIAMRKKTGWESYAQEPASFMQEVLNIKLSPRSKARCLSIIAGDDRRVGMVWEGMDSDEDIATFTAGLVIWRAATQGCNSIIVGGRPSIATGWHQHVCLVLNHAATEIKRDFLVAGRHGLRCVNGAWVMRYDGPLHEDYWESTDAAPEADIILGDFEWIDKDMIDEALDDAEHSDAMSLVIVNGDD